MRLAIDELLPPPPAPTGEPATPQTETGAAPPPFDPFLARLLAALDAVPTVEAEASAQSEQARSPRSEPRETLPEASEESAAVLAGLENDLPDVPRDLSRDLPRDLLRETPPLPRGEARGVPPLAPPPAEGVARPADRVATPADAAPEATRTPEATTPRETPARQTLSSVHEFRTQNATTQTEAATARTFSPRERDEDTSRRAGSRDAPSAATGVREGGREAARSDETAPRAPLPLEGESDAGRDTQGRDTQGWRDARPENQTGATGTAAPVRPAPVAAGSAQAAAPIPGVEATARSEAPPLPVLPVETAVETGVPGRVEWLAQRGGGSARLRLHPPELGELDISVRVRGNQVDVQIQAEQPAALHLVSESRDRLVDALAARDLRIESFELRGGDDRGAGSDSSRSPLGDPTHQGGGGHHPDPRSHRGESPASPLSLGNAPAVSDAPTDGIASRGIDLRV